MNRREGWKRQAAGVSLGLHLILFAGLFYWRPWSDPTDTESQSVPVDTDQQAVEDRGQSAAEQPARLSERTPIDAVSSTNVRTELTHLVREAQDLSPDQNLERLQGMVQRFDDIGSDQTVDELAGRFKKWWSIDEAKRPPTSSNNQKTEQEPHLGAEQPTAVFEAESAVIQSVERHRDDQGQWSYQAVLVDAQKNTQVIPLETAEGQRLYQTLKIVKSSPLVQRIYREITIPIMRRMLEQEDAASAGETATQNP